MSQKEKRWKDESYVWRSLYLVKQQQRMVVLKQVMHWSKCNLFAGGRLEEAIQLPSGFDCIARSLFKK